MTTKIHLTVNAVGRICSSIVGPGNQSDYRQASALVKGHRPVIAMADKGYDAKWFVSELEGAGVAQVIIPSKKNRRVQRVIDTEKYRGRNVIERVINRLKHYRRIATRFDKLAGNYQGFIFLAAPTLNAKFIL